MKWEVAESGLKGFLCPMAFMPIVSSLMLTADCAKPFFCYLGWLTVVEIVFLIVFWYQKHDDAFDLQVILHSNFLGFVGAIALRLLWESFFISGPDHFPLQSISIFILILCCFHFGEFVVTALFNSNSLTIDSFLLNHSTDYHLALLLAVIEFLAEYYWLPSKYTLWWLIPLGTLTCLVGEVIRKVAMISAGENFSHIIVQEHRDDHILVNDGIYGLFRHPSYLGWFLWSIGTQILLINPVCLVGYTVASWRFFEARIWEEERTLVRFFGIRYLNYKREVHSGIPFVKGY